MSFHGRVRRGEYWERIWSPVDDEDEAATESEYTAELILALEALTDKQRFVIECIYGLRPGGNNLPTCEVARLMGVSHQAVTRLHYRALRALRRGLRELPY